MRKCDKHPNCYDCPYLGTDECNPADIDCGPVIIEGKSSMDSWREVKSLTPASKAFKFIFYLLFFSFIAFSLLVCNAFTNIRSFGWARTTYSSSYPFLIISLYEYLILLNSLYYTMKNKIIAKVFSSSLRRYMVTLCVGMILMAFIITFQDRLIDLYNGFDLFGAWGVDERAVFLGNSFTYWFLIMNFVLMIFTLLQNLFIKQLKVFGFPKIMDYIKKRGNTAVLIILISYSVISIAVFIFIEYSSSIFGIDIPRWALDLIWPIFPPA